MAREQPVIVGIDVRDLKLAVTGTKTYLNEFLKAFEEINHPSIQFVYLDTNLPVYGGTSKLGKGLEHIYYFIWKQFLLPYKAWRKGCHILFCTDYFVPLVRLGFKNITVYHDALFFEIPEQYNPVWLRIFKTLALPGAKKSAKIVVPSNFSKERIQYFTGIDKEKFITIYEGPKTILTEEMPRKKLTSILDSIGDAPYLLHVGSLDKRKNLPRLIEALKLLKDRGHASLKLVLVGKASPKIFINNEQVIKQTIHDLNLKESVILTGYLEDEELGILYQRAKAYVFPSVYEGFGIPMVEAFRFNLPIAAANNSCLPEIGADAAIYFDPLNITDIADAIESMLVDKNRAEALIKAGQKRLTIFSWKLAAIQMNQLFLETADLH